MKIISCKRIENFLTWFFLFGGMAGMFVAKFFYPTESIFDAPVSIGFVVFGIGVIMFVGNIIYSIIE